MPIIFRATKGSRLTVSEIDGNFQSLSDAVNTKVDSANVIGIVDSAYVQSRQLKFDFLDSAEAISLIDATHVQARQTHYLDSVATQALIDATYIQANQSNIDSGLVVNLIDSSYVQARQVDLQRDSGFVTTIIDSSYVQERQTPQNFSYTSLTDVPDLFDSNDAIILIDSAYVQARQTSQDFAYASLTGKPSILDSNHVISIIGQEGIDSDLTTQLVDSAYIQLRDRFADSSLVTSTVDAQYVGARLGDITTHVLPNVDSTYDLGSSSQRWRDLYLSGNTIDLGGTILKSDANGQLTVNNKLSASIDSASALADSAANAMIPLGQAGQQLYYSANNSRSFAKGQMMEFNDKFVETVAEVSEEQNDRPTLEQIFNTWARFSHSGATQPIANATDANAWAYNSGPNTVSNPRNTSTPTGFYSSDVYESYTHTAKFTSGDADNDIAFVVVGFVVENGIQHTLSAVRQSNGTIGSIGTWALVYNIGQDHTNNDFDQTIIADASGTAPGTGNWSQWPNGTTFFVRKEGSQLTIKTSQFNSNTIDDTTVINFDLTSNPKTNRFAGPVAYGYGAWSQGGITISNLNFTPDELERLYFFDSSETTIYEFNGSNWSENDSADLTSKAGRMFNNTKTGRTFFTDGTRAYPVGSVRQFNDVVYLTPSYSEPDSADTGGLGLRAGMFATADGVSWDPVNRQSNFPYPVFWDGTQWNALY